MPAFMPRAAPIVHELVSELDYPMFIVTAENGRGPAGCMFGFATQCSIDPPGFLVCLSEKNRTSLVARDDEVVVVNIVPAKAEALAELFGSETGDEVDKFERCRWREGPRGLPLLEDCPAWFAGEVVDRLDAGDHVAFVLEPFAAEDRGGGQYSSRAAMRVEPGHDV